MATDLVARGMASSAKSLLSNVGNYTTIVASSNIFTIDLSNYSDFTIETTDTNAKTITFTNIPQTENKILGITIKLKQGYNATFTYPSGTIWLGGTSPTFTVGKTSILTFVSYNKGNSWLAYCVGEWTV